MKKWFFVWFIPLLWAVCSQLSFRFPGDELGLWAFSSIVGTWWCFVVPIHISYPVLSWLVTLTGALVLTPVGYFMDWIRVNHWVWAGFWVVSAAGLILYSGLSYESIARAVAKNGSLWAYLFAGLNAGLYLAIIAAALTRGLVVLAGRLQKPKS